MVGQLLILALLTTPLVPPSPADTTSTVRARSVGTAWGGRLENGVAMDLTGTHHRFTSNVRRKRSNFGTPEMVELLHRIGFVVDGAVNGPPMIIGSISQEGGGCMNPHKSHQTGRDVDILFYVIDENGRRRAARGFYDFDGHGVCQSRRCEGWRFDVQRNWHIVRTMVWSQRPQVQYIFVSNPLKALMLRYAEQRGEHPEIVRRARRVMAQPRNSSAHADHFHVRIYCSPDDRSEGCVDGGPRWSWVRELDAVRAQAAH